MLTGHGMQQALLLVSVLLSGMVMVFLWLLVLEALKIYPPCCSQALRDPSLNLSPIEQVVEDCKALLNTITEANITHIRQNTNAAAHRLAKVGLSLMQSCEWTGSPPSILTYILVEDCV
ncbi:hypothetical protein ACFX13_040064 [Malus domestica]